MVRNDFSTLNGELRLDLEEHKAWALKHWSRIDRNGDGRLSFDEINSSHLRKAIKEALGGYGDSGASYTRATMRLDRANELMRRKAENNGGVFRFNEFESFMYLLRDRGGVEGATLWAQCCFAMFDLDGDDYLQRAEFIELHRYFHGTQPEVIVEKEWQVLDTDGLGKVNKRRFVQWMTRGDRLRVLSEPQDPVMTRSASAPAGPEKKVHTPLIPSRATTSHSQPSRCRGPPWNRRHHVVSKNDGKPRVLREYFSRPQSGTELLRYYKTSQHFQSQLSMASLPPIEKPRLILSHETAPPTIPTRHVISGLSCTEFYKFSKVPHWTDLWQPSLSEMRTLNSYRPGSLGLRFGPPLPKPIYDPDWD